MCMHICGTLTHTRTHSCQQTSNCSVMVCMHDIYLCVYVCVLCLTLLSVQHVVHGIKWFTSIDLSKEKSYTNEY